VLVLSAAAIVVVSPFGEGGRAPLALFVLQTLSLACVVLAWTSGRPRDPHPARLLADPLRSLAVTTLAGLGLILLSALRASYPLAAALGAWDIVVPFLLFTAAARAVSDDRDLARLGRAVVASTSLQALLALARYPGGKVAGAGSSFVNPNHLAAFLNLGLFLILVGIQRPAPPRVRAAWGALGAMHVVAIFLLESRGALAAFFVTLIVFGMLRRRALPPRAWRIAVGFFLVCALGAALVLSTRFSRAVDPYRYTRLSIWKATAGMIAERPLLGFGPGMFPHVSPLFNFPADIGPVRYGRNFQGAHSAFLTLAAETGIPAAALILAALVGATLVCLRAPLGRDEVFGIGLGLLALLVQGCVEDLAVRPALTLVPALLLGAALARRRTGSGPPGPAPFGSATAPPLRPARFAGATLVAYLFLVAVLLPWRADAEASAALRLGRQGVSFMERAARHNPFHPDYRNDLAMAILNSGPLTPDGYARAAFNLLEARRLKPIDYRFPLHLARLEARAASSLFDDATAATRALSLYQEAVRLTPLDPRPRLELAAHYAGLKRPDDALGVLREALVLEPNFVRARVLEASILLDAGRRDEARASLEIADRILGALRGYEPDSGYARDITMDARSERERLAASLGAADPPARRS
jgi:O-antigen ligase/tetratricopeptide (TPR) repeat protein